MMFAKSFNDLPQVTRVGDVIKVIGAKVQEFHGNLQLNWQAFNNPTGSWAIY